MALPSASTLWVKATWIIKPQICCMKILCSLDNGISINLYFIRWSYLNPYLMYENFMLFRQRHFHQPLLHILKLPSVPHYNRFSTDISQNIGVSCFTKGILLYLYSIKWSYLIVTTKMCRMKILCFSGNGISISLYSIC